MNSRGLAAGDAVSDYKDDSVWLMQGDCLERMKEIPDGSVDLVLTDPPYNIAKDNNFTTMGRAGIDFGEWDKKRRHSELYKGV